MSIYIYAYILQFLPFAKYCILGHKQTPFGVEHPNTRYAVYTNELGNPVPNSSSSSGISPYIQLGRLWVPSPSPSFTYSCNKEET